jgi:hypothetical protein
MTPGGCEEQCWADDSCWEARWFDSSIDKACKNRDDYNQDSETCNVLTCEECLETTKLDGEFCSWFDGVYGYCAHENFRWDGEEGHLECFNLAELDEPEVFETQQAV